jgi:hypothetical protein
MTVKRILAALAVLGALAGGTAAATTTSHASASAPASFYHG